jgi:uncharacterized membrane protein
VEDSFDKIDEFLKLKKNKKYNGMKFKDFIFFKINEFVSESFIKVELKIKQDLANEE